MQQLPWQPRVRACLLQFPTPQKCFEKIPLHLNLPQTYKEDYANHQASSPARPVQPPDAPDGARVVQCDGCRAYANRDEFGREAASGRDPGRGSRGR